MTYKSILDLDVTLDIISNLREVAFHTVGILVVDNLKQLLQLGTYLRHLVVGLGVEQDFLQQVVVLVEHALGNLHVTLEGGTGGILMLHHGSKDERGDEGDGE